MACLLLAAGAQTSTAATAADKAGLLLNTGRQGSLIMGGTHLRQLKVGRCQQIHLVHVTIHHCAHCLRIMSAAQDAHHHSVKKQLH